jgi:hypothetical protein
MSSSACIKPDNDAASSVAADTRMMQQAQPKSAATRADTTTIRSSSWPIRWVGTMLSTSCAAGASLRELMERMGHSTTRAALIYQHRTSERDKLIADAMGKLAKAELRQRGRPSGTQRARKGRRAS